MHRLSRMISVTLVIASCALVSGAALAQAYPTKTIRLILPFPPGGPTDLIGRMVAQKLSAQVAQSVVADNRPGASGNLGLELTAKSPPDGYTIVLSSPVISLGPWLYSKLNYDPNKDLAPISLVGAVRNVLVVHPSVPARTLKELVQLARKNPGKLNYGSGGIGTTTHLAPEMLKSLEKLDIVHVPYKGSGLALIGVVSGQVDMLVMAAPAADAQIQAGRVRPLAVLSPDRLPALPKVPTAKESGYENFEMSVWYGILSPAGTPREIISRLNVEINKAMTAPDMKEKLVAAGIEPLTGTPEAFAAFIRSESTRFGKVIKEAGIKAE